MTTLSTEPAASGLPRCLESAAGAEQQLDRISTRTTGQAQREATATVEAIIERVRHEGDRALMALTEQFDGFRPEPLRVPAIELQKAWESSPSNLRDALELAHRRIQDFHQRQKPQDLDVQGVHGERLGRRWRPVQTAGLYAPGGRLDNQMNFGNPPFFPASSHLICINGSHEELEYNRGADTVLLSDPGAFFDAVSKVGKTWETWFEQQRDRRNTWVNDWFDHIDTETRADTEAGRNMHPLQLSLDVQSHLGPQDWLVFDGGNTHFWSEIAVNMAGWKGQKLGGILHPGNYSLLGVGVSFAISAKAAHPDQNVVLISGDGAFLSGGLSIEAAFQEGLPITVVIDNNGGLDCISQQQERLFSNGAHFATDFRDIPFHTMFEGLGGHGELVERRDQLGPALTRAMQSGKTACVNVKCRGVISPIVAATSDKRDKASIE